MKLGKSFEKHSGLAAADVMGLLFLTALRKVVDQSLYMDTQLQEAHEELCWEQEI